MRRGEEGNSIQRPLSGVRGVGGERRELLENDVFLVRFCFILGKYEAQVST